MFSPSLSCEAICILLQLVSCQLLWPLLTSPLYQPVITETSPEPVPYKKCRDKSIFLLSIAAESIPIMSFVGFVPKPYKLNIGMLPCPICHASYSVSVSRPSVRDRLSVPTFVVSLPSVHGSPQTTSDESEQALRFTNASGYYSCA